MADLEKHISINCKKTTEYPLIDEWQLKVLEYETWSIDNQKVLIPIARSYEGKWYADIYIYLKAEKRIERVVIKPDHELEEIEKLKLWEDNSDVGFSIRENEFFLSEISDLAPEINMKRYDDIRDALRHVYYASHKENLCEQLYKCQLDVIARCYEQIKDLRNDSTNIEDAFGLPLAFIRKMNSRFGLYTGLIDKRAREISAYTYKKFSGMLNDIDRIEHFQWTYLQDCLQDDILPDKDMLKKLSWIKDYYAKEKLDGEDIYDVFVSYKENRRIVKEMYDISFPKKVNCFDRPEELYSICYLAMDFAQRGDVIDMRIWDIYEETFDRYFYEDDNLFMRPPLSAKELMDEWKNQNNCLNYYILPLLDRETDILMLRRKSAARESFVTVEIADGKLEQAYKRNNEDIGQRERTFLLSFCKEKNIICNI